MATKQLNARIVLRNDTKAQWALANPILLKGEIGVEFDPNATAADRKILFKIGDGVAHWNDLPYGGGDFAEVIAELQADVEVLEEKAATLNYQKVNNVWVPVRIQTLENTVGDATHGLVKSVADLQVTVGTSSSGLVKDVYDLKQTVGGPSAGLVKKVGDLETTVGDSSAGLVKRVGDLETDATDLDTRLDTVEGTVGTLTASVGVAGSIANQLYNVQTNLQNQIGSGFGDSHTVAAAINTLETAVDTLNASAGIAGSVDNKIYAVMQDQVGPGFGESHTVAAAISSLDGRIDALEGNHFEVVSELPLTGQSNVIYLVPDANVGYKEWIYIKTGSNPDTYAWEEIGDTNIDLSNYYTKTDADARYSQLGHDHDGRYYTKTIMNATFATITAVSAAISASAAAADAKFVANTDVLILDCGVATSNYSAS